MPLLFSLQFLQPGPLIRALLATGCFCLVSSAVYILNDLLDAESDRRHVRKRERPIASGNLSPVAAVFIIAALLASASAVAVIYLSTAFVFFAVVYIANSVLYCIWLKHKVIVDVMSIAAGFVLRLLAGCVVIGVSPTPWIIVCGFSLALVLGFGKRRIEIAQEVASEHRPVLDTYTPAKLDTLLSVVTAVCLVSYMLYTVSEETVRRHRTENLIYTIPLVAYGLFRYLFKVQEGKGGDGPAELLVTDWVFPAVAVLWVSCVALILYLA